MTDDHVGKNGRWRYHDRSEIRIAHNHFSEAQEFPFWSSLDFKDAALRQASCSIRRTLMLHALNSFVQSIGTEEMWFCYVWRPWAVGFKPLSHQADHTVIRMFGSCVSRSFRNGGGLPAQGGSNLDHGMLTGWRWRSPTRAMPLTQVPDKLRTTSWSRSLLIDRSLEEGTEGEQYWRDVIF